MTLDGSLTLGAAPEALRAALADPEALSRALPGVDGFGWFEGPDEGSFKVTIRPALALGEIPVRTVWRRVTADADGAGGAPGAGAEAAADGTLRYRVEGRTDEQRVDLDVALRVAPAEGGGSLVAWQLGVHVTGTLRAAGQRVVAPIVEHQVRQVLTAAAEAAR